MPIIHIEDPFESANQEFYEEFKQYLKPYGITLLLRIHAGEIDLKL